VKLVICIFIALVGFLIGAVAGAVGFGYLIIFKSFDWMGTVQHGSDWVKIGEGILVLLFTKSAIIVGGITGGVIGSIPGVLGITKCCEED
jgi:hypothetical protein